MKKGSLLDSVDIAGMLRQRAQRCPQIPMVVADRGNRNVNSINTVSDTAVVHYSKSNTSIR